MLWITVSLGRVEMPVNAPVRHILRPFCVSVAEKST
jgi:hypothetical protein